MDNKPIIVNINQLDASHKHEHPDYEYHKRVITPRSTTAQCYVCVYDIPPQKFAYPYHYHTSNTEVFHILQGKGSLQTPEGQVFVKAGDIIVFPPGAAGAHKLQNSSDHEMLTYMDYATTNSPDIVHYPDSHKVGVIVHGTSADFFSLDQAVDYYKDE